MVTSCAAYGCKEQFRKGGPVTFHSFPKDPIIRKKWTIAVRREGFVPTIYSKVCSKHFTEECFNREKFGGCWLQANAVPTLFNFSGESPTQKSLRRSSKRKIEETSSSSSSSDLSSFPLPERSASTEKLTNGTSILQSLLTPIQRNSSTEHLYESSESTFSLHTLSKSRGSSLFTFNNGYIECITNGKDFDDEPSLTPSIRWEGARQKVDLEKRLEVAQKEKKRLRLVLRNMRRKITYLRKANAAMKDMLEEKEEWQNFNSL